MIDFPKLGSQTGDVNNVICIDFDRTIMDHENVAPGHKMGYPEPDVIESMNELWNRGFRLVVLTARPPATHRIIAQYLKYFNIPFSQITNIKPEAIAYIDDRAIRYEDNWPQITKAILTQIDINPEARI